MISPVKVTHGMIGVGWRNISLTLADKALFYISEFFFYIAHIIIFCSYSIHDVMIDLWG